MEGDNHRSGCPINLSLEVFGDRWSLLILRDMMFGGSFEGYTTFAVGVRATPVVAPAGSTPSR